MQRIIWGIHTQSGRFPADCSYVKQEIPDTSHWWYYRVGLTSMHKGDLVFKGLAVYGKTGLSMYLIVQADPAQDYNDF